MSIKHTILGFLGWKAFTGYELKKVFAESVTLSWSGNSNQIYTTLVDLHRQDLVSLDIQHQESGPSRKVYTITDKGLEELRSWMLSSPVPPVQKNMFLNQITWAAYLNDEEIDTLLKTYEEKLQTQLLVFRARDQRKDSPQRTARETYLWNMISENWDAFYQDELSWVRKVRAGLAKLKLNRRMSHEGHIHLQNS